MLHNARSLDDRRQRSVVSAAGLSSLKEQVRHVRSSHRSAARIRDTGVTESTVFNRTRTYTTRPASDDSPPTTLEFAN